MSAFNRFESCSLYLSPAHAAPSALGVPILRFSTLDEGLAYFKLKIKPESWHFYRLVTESGGYSAHYPSRRILILANVCEHYRTLDS